jgi:hypothetical protein
MAVSNPKKVSKKQIKKNLSAPARPKKGNLKKFFGINPTEIDGLEFQKKARAEWD